MAGCAAEITSSGVVGLKSALMTPATATKVNVSHGKQRVAKTQTNPVANIPTVHAIATQLGNGKTESM
jgi:hypothetical protein